MSGTSFERLDEDQLKREHERKFTVDDREVPEHFDSDQIRQGYIRTDGDFETRIRSINMGEFKFTIKGKGDVSRPDLEIDIDEQTFYNIYPLITSRIIDKTRYKIDIGEGLVAEYDVFAGDLYGLRTVEVEFETEEDAASFVPPDWFGEDVSKMPEYKNKNLSIKGMPDSEIQPDPPKRSEIMLEAGLKGLISYSECVQEALSRPIIVAVAGGSASGKTSAVAEKLAEHFGDRAVTISMDDYYRGVAFMEAQAANGVELNWDEPAAVDLEKVIWDIGQLRAGSAINKPVYDFISGEATKTENLQLGDRTVIILEGLFALTDEIARISDVTCFVNIETHGRMLRRLLRDIQRTSWSPNEIVNYFSVLEDMHNQYVQPTIENADIVIDNQYNPIIEAQRSGQYELQVKFAVDDIDVDKLIKIYRAELIHGQVKQTDVYLNPRGKDLSESDEIIRLRKTGGSLSFGYKGPREDDPIARRRPKVEFPIDPKTYDVIQSMYPETTKTITKTRATLMIDGVLVEIDEVFASENGETRSLGKFLEFRTNDSSGKLYELSRKLGLDFDKAERRSYFEM